MTTSRALEIKNFQAIFQTCFRKCQDASLKIYYYFLNFYYDSTDTTGKSPTDNNIF